MKKQNFVFYLTLPFFILVKTLMAPVVLHLEFKRQKAEAMINKELWLQNALDQKLQNVMQVYGLHNLRVRNGYNPTAEEFVKYSKAKKEMDFIHEELRESDKRIKALMLAEKELSWEIQEISLSYFVRQAFGFAR